MKKSWIKRGKKPVNKKSEKQKHREYLDYFFLTLIVLRDKVCSFCGVPADTGHHIFMKGAMHMHIRYDPKNACGICEPCHSPAYGRGIHAVPHNYQDRLEAWVNNKWGAGAWERLEARAYMQGGGLPDPILVELELKQILLQDYNYRLARDWAKKAPSTKIKLLRELRRETRKLFKTANQ